MVLDDQRLRFEVQFRSTVVTMFVIAAHIVEQQGMEAGKAFIAEVNAHIDALTAWEDRRAAFAGETALRGTLEPQRGNCDSDAAFESVHGMWMKAQAGHPCPAPSARIAIERSIEVHTAADGSRTYTYLSDPSGDGSVYRDHLIQRNKELSDAD
jgi:hypothetical protein